MSWATKQHEKNKLHKMIQQAMNSPEYKAARNHDMQQATLRAITRFTFIGLLYLEMNFHCKRKAFIKFIDFVKTTIEEIGDDIEFIDDSNKYYKEKYELDVMNYLGAQLERDCAERFAKEQETWKEEEHNEKK